MLREETEKADSLLIFDEVMTSRLGRAGAQSLVDITPDMTTLGKWIGGGMSFGAFGGRTDVMDLFDPRREDAIAHAGTFNNNVLTMAAGITALGEIYTEDRALALSAWGDSVRERLNEIAREVDVPVTAIGLGSLMCLHPSSGDLSNSAGVAAADDRLREILFLDLLYAGYYIARRGFVALSLAVKDEDMAGFYEAFRAVLQRRVNLFRAFG